MDNIDQGGFNNQHSPQELLTAEEAAALLEVKLATLYAYVSRGLLHSVRAEGGSGPGSARGNRYARVEVLRLKTRAKARSGHGPVAAAALDFGEPVLESGLTEMTAEGPYYRGHSAVELAQRGTPFESVAELLWNGSLPATPPHFFSRPKIAPASLSRLLPAGTTPLSALTLLVPALALRDAVRFAAPPEVEKERARQLIPILCAGLALGGEQDLARFRAALSAKDVASAVATALTRAGKPSDEMAQAINQALVLLADHELNMSTFTARVAASAGADLYACLGAALYTLSGPRHGAASERVEALVNEAKRSPSVAGVIAERLRRGELVPGFGHPLYPGGDPRTPPLLKTAQALSGRRAGLSTLLSLTQAMADAGHPPPNVDIGLVALTLSLGLPAGSASCLFAIGRVVGWVAHILEQRESGMALRPRARYSGPQRRPQKT